MNNEELSQIFRDSCEKNNITDDKIVADITTAGTRLFSIGTSGQVVANSDFANISEFVQAYQQRQQHKAIPKKQRLMGRLIDLAEAGDMKGFRQVRAEYSKA